MALQAYHNACLEEAKLAQSLPVETRRSRSLLLPLDGPEFQNLVQEVNAFAQELISKYRSDQYEGRRLYKLNLQFFPVSEKIESATELPGRGVAEKS